MLLHTTIKGSGEPLIFLHTGLEMGESDFVYQREFFEDSFQVIAPDLRGHGKSITDDYTNFFEDCARDLKETIEHYQWKKVHLVGCSLGGIVAVLFGQLFPEYVKTLTLSGILPYKPEDWHEQHQADVSTWNHLLNSEEARGYFESIHESDWTQFLLLGMEENWYPFEEMNAIKSFAFPVLFLVGEKNKVEASGAVSYPLSNSLVHGAIIPYAGHLAHIEQPEIYTTILAEFLKQNS